MNEITRFDLDMDGSMEPSEHGRWVRYKDAQRQCTWPICQSEEYQQALAEQIKQELVTGAAQPAVPDAFGTREGEHPQYIQGWNDCRAEMLRGNT